MQEEVTQRTVALCVEATKLSAGMLQQAMKKVLDEMQKGVTGHKTKLHHGKQTLRQLNCNLRRLDFQQEQGLMSSLPLANNLIEIQRALTTSSTAIFIPFTTQELFQNGDEALYRCCPVHRPDHL